MAVNAGVAWRIQECHDALVGFDMVGADMLRNTTGFAAGYFGFANVIEQRGFAVVDVAHHGHNRRARLFGAAVRGQQFNQRFFDRIVAD